MSKMLEEIQQQPEALERTLKAALPEAAKLKKVLERDPPRMVLFAARGTSDNAAQFGRYLIEVAAGVPAAMVAPSVYTLYRKRLDLRHMLVVGISQSGESTDTNMVLKRARQYGARTLAITNEPESSMASLADHTFLVRAGKEKSVAATKTYTGQLAVQYLLAEALGAGFANAELMRIPERAAQALRLHDKIGLLVERYRYMSRALVIGRGLNYANAFEFALKLMETSYVVAERFSSADLLHGPVAMVEKGFPVFLFAPSGVTWRSLRETLHRVQQVQAETVVITDQGNPAARGLAGRCLQLPFELQEAFTPIPYIIPAQLFAALLAVTKGLNPDQPRTLTKVTRTL